jgi:hypothetical protein
LPQAPLPSCSGRISLSSDDQESLPNHRQS